MPALGPGVFQSPPEETAAAVKEALSLGYRHIDTAAAYMNEREVGDGIRGSGLRQHAVVQRDRRYCQAVIPSVCARSLGQSVADD